MKLTRKLKKQIEKDIEYCNSFDTKNGTKKAYDELIARYSELDADFLKGIPTNGKAYVIGSEPNYKTELHAIAIKLQTYLMQGKINDDYENTQNRKNKIIVAIITMTGTILAAILGSLISILVA